MQQNFRQSLGAAVAWDANSQYQICNVYGQAGIFLYQYVPLVNYNSSTYQLSGTALNNGTPPSSDPAYIPIGGSGGGGGMLPLPQGQIYVGNSVGQPAATVMSGDAEINGVGTVTIFNQAVIDKVLTGYVSTPGTVSAADSILTAIEKVNGNTQALTSLSSGNIIVGNASNNATGVPMSGDVTISNTGATTIGNSAVIDQELTGFTATTGTITATDTILSGIEKLSGNATALTTLVNDSVVGQFQPFDSYLINTNVNNENQSNPPQTVMRVFAVDSSTLSAGLSAGASNIVPYNLPPDVQQILGISAIAYEPTATLTDAVNFACKIVSITGTTSIEFLVTNLSTTNSTGITLYFTIDLLLNLP